MDSIRDTLRESSCDVVGLGLLRVAIVARAVEDYKMALDNAIDYHDASCVFCTISSLESFFYSHWGELLCGRDMHQPLTIIRRKVANERKKRHKK